MQVFIGFNEIHEGIFQGIYCIVGGAGNLEFLLPKVCLENSENLASPNFQIKSLFVNFQQLNLDLEFSIFLFQNPGQERHYL